MMISEGNVEKGGGGVQRREARKSDNETRLLTMHHKSVAERVAHHNKGKC